MAFSPTQKSVGDLIRSKDWNEAMNEIVRLESAKLNITGGTVNGPLSVQSLGLGTIGPPLPDRPLTVRGAGGAYLNLIAGNGPQEVLLGADANGGVLSTMTNHDLQLRAGGNVTRLTVKADGKVGIGTNAPGFGLDVADRIRLRQGTAPSAGLWLFQTTPSSDRAFIGMADDNTLGLFGNTGASPNWGLTMNTATLDITLGSDLYIRTTGGGFARFTKQTFDRLGEPLNYLKLVMPSSTDSPFIFAIGYTSVVGSITSFVNQFSLNQNGNLTIRGSLTAGGGKGGFVVENFINSVGDTLEQGDVVIVGGHEVDRYYGVGNSIPVPEVDLTDQAYDTRVCGIVDTVVW